jgi:hypothetical protein
MWNEACNDWALGFWEYADIMVESKCKNLATLDLYNYANTRNNLHRRSQTLDVQQSQNWTRAKDIVIA